MNSVEFLSRRALLVGFQFCLFRRRGVHAARRARPRKSSRPARVSVQQRNTHAFHAQATTRCLGDADHGSGTAAATVGAAGFV